MFMIDRVELAVRDHVGLARLDQRHPARHKAFRNPGHEAGRIRRMRQHIHRHDKVHGRVGPDCGKEPTFHLVPFGRGNFAEVLGGIYAHRIETCRAESVQQAAIVRCQFEYPDPRAKRGNDLAGKPCEEIAQRPTGSACVKVVRKDRARIYEMRLLPMCTGGTEGKSERICLKGRICRPQERVCKRLPAQVQHGPDICSADDANRQVPGFDMIVHRRPSLLLTARLKSSQRSAMVLPINGPAIPDIRSVAIRKEYVGVSGRSSTSTP